jgi:hypothetical protein
VSYLRDLLNDLLEMFRKFAVQFVAESRGEEANARVRAGAFAAGESAMRGFPRPDPPFDNWHAYSLRRSLLEGRD